MASKYRTGPAQSTKMPPGIPFIVGNETAERFSFYGMKAILLVFMTEYLLASDGSRAVMTGEQAKFYFHAFVAAAYFFPVIGSIISDAFLGKYRTIILLSIVYCLGHLALAMDETRLGLFLGLTLIAIGAGGIKPCVSAHVGDQFGTRNQHLVTKVFAWFYFAINLGAAVSSWLTPILLHNTELGPGVAFGVPGVLMLIATIVFWMGRNRFVHVPAAGMASIREAFSGAGLTALKNLSLIYLFVAMFWALFDQTGSAWVLQAKRMDRQWLGIEWLPSQIQVANPVLILVFIPLFSYVIYPAIDRVYKLTPLRKISIGFFIAVMAWTVPAMIDMQITGGEIVAIPSEGDGDKWPVENLIDGRVDGTGWVSASREEFTKRNKEQFPQEIVIRLRERKDWKISSVRFQPNTDLQSFLKKQQPDAGKPTEELVRACWAKEVEVLVGPARVKPWKSVGTITLRPDNAWQELSFDAVTAQYVVIRIKSNGGGRFVSLGDVEVISPNSLLADSDQHATDVLPNVAATGFRPSIVWQLVAYVLLTAAEIMISITGLELSYTQAPKKMKSFIMSLWLLSVAVGNGFTALVNIVIQNGDGSSKLEGPAYYLFFLGFILAAAIGFLFVARNYKGQTYIQDEANDGA